MKTFQCLPVLAVVLVVAPAVAMAPAAPEETVARAAAPELAAAALE
jgi:hypothetical protein